MDILLKNCKELIPYVNNSRVHSITQIQQIAGSIKEFGFTSPILIDNNNMILAGHGRVEAANLLKIEQIPCIVLTNLSEIQKKAYILADNKISLNSDWDYELLKLEIENLNENNFNLDILSFDSSELSQILGITDLEDIEVKEENYKQVFEVIIECKNECQQEDLYNEMVEKGLKCRILSM